MPRRSLVILLAMRRHSPPEPKTPPTHLASIVTSAVSIDQAPENASMETAYSGVPLQGDCSYPGRRLYDEYRSHLEVIRLATC